MESTGPRYRDFVNAAGAVDWKAYHAAEGQNGNRCRECRAYIVFGHGEPQACPACKRLEADRDSVCSHESQIRCPACGGTWDAYEAEVLLEASGGSTDVSCPGCDHGFTVLIETTYTFTSPEMD